MMDDKSKLILIFLSVLSVDPVFVNFAIELLKFEWKKMDKLLEWLVSE